MRQPAGRARVAEALTSYAEEAAKNTSAGRLFADDVSPVDVLRRAAVTSIGKISDLLSAGAQELLASSRRAKTDERQGGFDFDAPPAPSSEIKPRTPFQTQMHALADTMDGVAANPAFGEMPSGAHPSAYERQRALAGAVKDVGRSVDRVLKEMHAASGSDISYDGNEVSTHLGDLIRSIKDKATEMRADMRDPDLVGKDGARPHADLRKMAADIAKDVREAADDNPWIKRPADGGEMHPDDLRALADHAEGLSDRLTDFTNEAHASSEAFYMRGEDGRLEFQRPMRDEISDAHSLHGDLRDEADAYGTDDVSASARPRLFSPEWRERVAADRQTTTALNPATGAMAKAIETGTLRDMLDRFDVTADPRADLLSRAFGMAIGKVLKDVVGDTKVNVLAPDAMRTMAEGRIKLAPGTMAEAIFDRKTNEISILDDFRSDPAEASRVLLHEGLHAALMHTINGSSAAAEAMDALRTTALAMHMEAGGEMADHYGLSSVHEFVSEAGSNPEFQRFLSEMPADARMAKAFGLDDAPGHSLWDVFVAAVRKLLGMAPDQHSLLDAAMRGTRDLFEERAQAERAAGGDAVASVRKLGPFDPAEADAPLTPEEQASRARAFSNAKDAISYAVNADRIAQHPNGPLAGFLGILTRDIHDKGGINVEAVQQDYEGRMAQAVEHILEPYGSKRAGLKGQDVAGIRDVIREVFGVDTGSETAKTAAHAWSQIDTFSTTEAKRLGKVFSPAEDWRVPQFWESSRAQKFGRAALLADMRREVDAGGLKVFDPDTHEEANPLRRAAILEGAADKITTDASLGGTPGKSGSFRSDMRVFRFADGAAGADSYLRLMDKYGAGRGGYLQMMQSHVGKVSRELGLSRVLGPGWAEVGEKLLQDSQLAQKKIDAAREPRDASQRLKDLPQDAGKTAIGWLESPTKADAVWQHMSGQSSGIGSELVAGVMSGTRAFMTATRMGSAIVTAVPADTVNWLMAAKHNGLPMGRMVSEITKTFLADSAERRQVAAQLGIVAHAGADAAIATKRFEDQFVGQGLMKRLADFVIRAQGLHAWDSAIKRVFPMEFLGAIGRNAGKAFGDLEEPFANFLDRFGLKDEWPALSQGKTLDALGTSFLHPDSLPEATRVKLMSAIYDERQFAYLAGGSERVRAMSSAAKAGTFAGETARSIFLFKSLPMQMLATWGMRSAQEAGNGRIATLATLITGMTMAGALAMQARAILQGKDPRSMKDPFFWGESFLQGGAAGIYGDFFKEAFSRSDTSLTETALGPLSAIPAGIQGLTSGARRAAESGEKVNFGSKLARIISQNTPGGNLWYARLLASRIVFDNIQRMIDRDHDAAFARQQQRAMKLQHQGFFWAPGQSAPGRAPDLGAMMQ